MALRSINLANEARRDAVVGFQAAAPAPRNRLAQPGGGEPRHVRYVKSLADLGQLTGQYGDLLALGQAIVASDPEVDIEQVGRPLTATHRIYVRAAGEIAYRVNLQQVVYSPDGTEKERRDLNRALANIATEQPVAWSGRLMPKDQALRKFVFGRHYQLQHNSGLTYDFLYAMAQQLDSAKALMYIGTGAKGTGPLILTNGGENYRGFLEGRISGDSYQLILHLTNLELKPLSDQSPEEA